MLFAKILIQPIVWLSAFLAFCLALPSLGSTVAFAAATSIATIGLYISYGIPILLAVLYSKDFAKGPFNLGWASIPIGTISVMWIMFISIVFCLPTSNPVTTQTLNYTVVAVGIIAVFSVGAWVVSARKWFVGPLREAELELQQVSEPGVFEKEVEAGKSDGSGNAAE